MTKSKTSSGPEQAARTRLRRKSRRITEILAETYGSPNLNNKQDPLDELVFILLSLMTTAPSFNRVFDQLKAVAPDWETVRDMPVKELAAIIKDAGLSQQKAPRIKAILIQTTHDFGRPSLDALSNMSDADAERYLTSLPGVGLKTAKCVMLFSLGRKVLPVDTNVWRVAVRLGLIGANISYTHVHDALEAVVRPDDRYNFHVNSLAHGRALCLAVHPRCSRCPLLRFCPYGRNHIAALHLSVT